MDRRRIYLMRHAEVRYFEGVLPEEVVLTENGRRQAEAAREALAGIPFDRVLTSGLPRTLETAAIVAPGREPEHRRGLREIEGGELRGLEPQRVEELMRAAFRGAVPLETRFLGGETVGELVDRVLAEAAALLADHSWDVALLVLHGGVNRALLSHALTGQRTLLGGFEQSPGCVNVLDVGEDWIVRAVNHTPYDPAHAAAPRTTTMEQLWADYLEARKRTAGGAERQ
jgi:broad specificity phosphatase PhoE